MKCKDCKYWQYRTTIETCGEGEDAPFGVGDCRRNPPICRGLLVRLTAHVPDDDFDGGWPETDEDMWCGEFEAKLKTE